MYVNTHLSNVVDWKFIFYYHVSYCFYRSYRLIVMDNDLPFLVYWEVKVVIEDIVADIISHRV